MRSRATVQSPSGFANVNLRRAGLRGRLEDSGYRYKITPAETLAGLTDANLTFGYDPGDVLRYGADPTGAVDSSPAWKKATDCNAVVFDGYPGGGDYLFTAPVLVTNWPIRIRGSCKEGTSITLTSATSQAAHFIWSAFARSVVVERIGFFWSQHNKSQSALKFAELRSSRIIDCLFEGVVVGSPVYGAGTNNTRGIRFTGTGTFTGDVTVRDCYFTSLGVGIELLGTITTLRIVDNEMYGQTETTGNAAVLCQSSDVFGVKIDGNTFQDWHWGIYYEGTHLKQSDNYFETNDITWEWVRGTTPNVNARCWNKSEGDTIISGGAPVYPFNNVDACVVLSGPGYYAIDTASINVRRGYQERGRTELLGVLTPVAYAAGNFTANGGATWTVDAGDVSVFQIERTGTRATVIWKIVTSATSVASPTQLVLHLPFVAIDDGEAVVMVNIAGTKEACLATIAAGSSLVGITRMGAGGSFGQVVIETSGQLSFECD